MEYHILDVVVLEASLRQGESWPGAIRGLYAIDTYLAGFGVGSDNGAYRKMPLAIAKFQGIASGGAAHFDGMLAFVAVQCQQFRRKVAMIKVAVRCFHVTKIAKCAFRRKLLANESWIVDF